MAVVVVGGGGGHGWTSGEVGNNECRASSCPLACDRKEGGGRMRKMATKSNLWPPNKFHGEWGRGSRDVHLLGLVLSSSSSSSRGLWVGTGGSTGATEGTSEAVMAANQMCRFC